MTREEALNKAINIVRYFEAHFAKSKEAREDAVNIIEALEQEPCEGCEVGNPCLYCRHKFEPQQTIQEKQAESEKYQKAFDDGYDNGYAQARFDYEQEPCEGCEVGNPCLYCRHEFEPQERSEKE